MGIQRQNKPSGGLVGTVRYCHDTGIVIEVSRKRQTVLQPEDGGLVPVLGPFKPWDVTETVEAMRRLQAPAMQRAADDWQALNVTDREPLGNRPLCGYKW